LVGAAAGVAAGALLTAKVVGVAEDRTLLGDLITNGLVAYAQFTKPTRKLRQPWISSMASEEVKQKALDAFAELEYEEECRQHQSKTTAILSLAVGMMPDPNGQIQNTMKRTLTAHELMSRVGGLRTDVKAQAKFTCAKCGNQHDEIPTEHIKKCVKSSQCPHCSQFFLRNRDLLGCA